VGEPLYIFKYGFYHSRFELSELSMSLLLEI